MNDQQFIPVGIQHELDRRIEAARGNIAAVRQELEKQLQSLGALQATQVVQSPEAQGTNGEIALLRGELLYLDSLAEEKKNGHARAGRHSHVGRTVPQEPVGWRARWQAAQPTKAVVVWAFVAGIALTWLVGFTWGGWVSGGTAAKMATSAATAAVVERLAPICVAQFNLDPNKAQKLQEMTALSSYQRPEYVRTQGWATMPGETEPDRRVGDACATLLMQPSQ
jgi:hypothetical protein